MHCVPVHSPVKPVFPFPYSVFIGRGFPLFVVLRSLWLLQLGTKIHVAEIQTHSQCTESLLFPLSDHRERVKVDVRHPGRGPTALLDGICVSPGPAGYPKFILCRISQIPFRPNGRQDPPYYHFGGRHPLHSPHQPPSPLPSLEPATAGRPTSPPPSTPPPAELPEGTGGPGWENADGAAPPPSEPRGLAQGEASSRWVELRWLPPAQPHGNLSAYAIFYKEAGSDRYPASPSACPDSRMGP